MEKFNTMLEAAEFADTLCRSWSFATSNDRYDVKGLLVLAVTLSKPRAGRRPHLGAATKIFTMCLPRSSRIISRKSVIRW